LASFREDSAFFREQLASFREHWENWFVMFATEFNNALANLAQELSYQNTFNISTLSIQNFGGLLSYVMTTV
jgi:hypothetical protein